MRMLMPSHARKMQHWRENQPLFARMGVEAQLDAMFSAQVTLKSGGYIVINQTEALVAIDVNSGRSTREHNIEDTALRTNLEASDEVARQLRLRDLAGLIVVDFIDMEENRNNRAVERRLKEALKNDRARIQVGRISHFGLLEMSRQRMRTGVLEGSSVVCPHCNGAGTVRSTSSIALHILRVIEDALVRNAQHNLTVRTRSIVALYMLNQKRAHLREIEERFGVTLTIAADDTLQGSVYHVLERGELASPAARPAAPRSGADRFPRLLRDRGRGRDRRRSRGRIRQPRATRTRATRSATRTRRARTASAVAAAAVAAAASASPPALIPTRRSHPTTRLPRWSRSAATLSPPARRSSATARSTRSKPSAKATRRWRKPMWKASATGAAAAVRVAADAAANVASATTTQPSPASARPTARGCVRPTKANRPPRRRRVPWT